MGVKRLELWSAVMWAMTIRGVSTVISMKEGSFVGFFLVRFHGREARFMWALIDLCVVNLMEVGEVGKISINLSSSKPQLSVDQW